MSQGLYGHIPEFYGDGDDWNVYYERMEQFFTVNDIPAEKRSAFLISVIGSYSYKSLRDLCHPDLPKNKTFDELCELLNRQFTPQIAVFRERSKFYNAHQETYENISGWYARLKKLSVDCRFGDNLETVLLDKFITGLRSGQILDRLCEENETVTLQQALVIAINKECALAEVEDNQDMEPTCGPQIAICPCAPCDSAAASVINDENPEPKISCCPPIKKCMTQNVPKAICDMVMDECPPVESNVMPTAQPVMSAPPVNQLKENLNLIRGANATVPEMFQRQPVMSAPQAGFGSIQAHPVMAAPPQPAFEAMPSSAPLPKAHDSNLQSAPIAMRRMKAMIKESPMEEDDDVDGINLQTEEVTKKKNRRGCRGGRKTKKQ